MNIVIASGKGGTGKTTFAVNYAWHLNQQLERELVLLDCDVEEPNSHLFLQLDTPQQSVVTASKPDWQEDNCIACGKCVAACNYNALALVNEEILVFNELCHSCGTCNYVCPTKAMPEKATAIGEMFYFSKNNVLPFDFGYGLLNIGESLAPKVIQELLDKYALSDINIIDAPPGTGCPVVETLNHADVAVMVTEPTPFGLRDLRLAVELSLSMKIPTGIIINRSDEHDTIIEDYAREIGVPLLGKIPFDRKYAEAYARGKVLVNEFPELNAAFADIHQNIIALNSSKAPAVIPAPPTFTEDGSKVLWHEKGNATSYKEIVVISGKGGTGKTTVTAALGQLCDDKVLFDADVNAADMHLLIKPQATEIHDFTAGKTAIIDSETCFGCGKCAKMCHFNAINMDGPGNDLINITYQVNNFACEGCGLCELVCPVQAVKMEVAENGHYFFSQTAHGTMVHAELGIGEENSGKLVSKVRAEAANFAEKLAHGTILGDGPPGTGCPVIASTTGADLMLIVTEPTVSGAHDLERVLKLTRHFQVKSLIVINKADLNPDMVEQIKAIAQTAGSEVIAEIPFDREVHQALLAGKTILEHGKGSAFTAITGLWKTINDNL
jgi:MinD superfamily P-loop ATPase